MRIQILSDLHLEVNPNFDIPVTDADVLVVAGDIHNGKVYETVQWLDHWRSSHRKPLIFVLGNHDFYGYEYATAKSAFKLLCKDIDVILLDNSSYHWKNYKTEEEVTFIGGTMWSDQKFNHPNIKNDLADYFHIRNSANCVSVYDGPGMIKDKDTIAFHNEFLLHAEALVNAAKTKICMVSHHGPSGKSIHPYWDGDPRNGYFSSPVLERHSWCDKVGLWLHGHTHCSLDYRAGETRVVVNPLGYGGGENPKFNPRLVIEY